MAIGTVKFYKAEKGWGALMTDELPEGDDVFVIFSAIEGQGFPALDAGDIVDFDYEAGRQDSFRYRATRARVVRSGPAPTLRRHGDQVAVVPAGTPETPLTPKRSSPAGSRKTKGRNV